MIPRYLILDSSDDYRYLEMLTQYHPVEDGEAFRVILECLTYENNALHELDIMGLDVATMMLEGGHGELSAFLSAAMVRAGHRLFRKLQAINAYYNGYLVYTYHHDLEGDLVLESLTEDDLKYYGIEGVSDERSSSV
jgi:hypothetical protein